MLVAAQAFLLAATALVAAAQDEETRALYVGAIDETVRERDTFVAGPEFATLAEAAAAAHDGDVIYVLPATGAADAQDGPLGAGGRHRADVRIDRSVSLLGIAAVGRPVLSGTLTLAADGIVVDGLAFTAATTQSLVLEAIEGARVERCLFLDTPGGIVARNATRCIFRENVFVRAGAAVTLDGGGAHLVERNVAESCGWYAIELATSTGNRLLANHVARSGWVGMILYAGAHGNTIDGNTISGGQVALSIETSDNVVTDNRLTQANRGLLLGRSPKGRHPSLRARGQLGDPRIEGNVVDGNVVRDCRSEGILVAHARANVLRHNRIRDCGEHGIVLMQGADENRLETNVIAPHRRGAVRIVGAQGNLVDGEPAAGAEDEDADSERDASGFLVLFGDLHVHSRLSDGATPPEDAFIYARDVLDHDFLGVSDHAESLAAAPESWRLVNELVERFAVADEFVTFAGYETTFDVAWDGHYNSYFAAPADEAPVVATFDARWLVPSAAGATPYDLLDRLRAGPVDFVTVRHHYQGTPDYWRDAPPDGPDLPLTEIASVHGTWSGDLDADQNRSLRGTETARQKSTMRGGLSQGRVFGVVGGSDTHFGLPGDFGIAGVLARERTREAIVEAMRARRTFATTGARMRLSFTLDGAPMGSIVDPAAAPAIEATVAGTAAIDEFVLFEGDRVVARAEPDGTHATLSFACADVPAAGTVFQVRARQVDGEYAWSSPIFVNPTPPAPLDDETRLDKKRMVLLVQAEYLRRWPLIPLPGLDGVSADEASQRPEFADRLREAFAAYQRACDEWTRVAADAGLDEETAARAHARFAPMFRDAPEQLKNPRIHPDRVKRNLGL